MSLALGRIPWINDLSDGIIIIIIIITIIVQYNNNNNNNGQSQTMF
jgi:hypothetical protein